MSAERNIIALDPGLNVGIAVVARDGALLYVGTGTEMEALKAVTEAGHGTEIVVGDGTGSTVLAEALRGRGFEPHILDETGSTLEARELYWRRNPASWPLNMLPLGLRPVPQGIDGYAAWVLARRWLASSDGQ